MAGTFTFVCYCVESPLIGGICATYHAALQGLVGRRIADSANCCPSWRIFPWRSFTRRDLSTKTYKNSLPHDISPIALSSTQIRGSQRSRSTCHYAFIHRHNPSLTIQLSTMISSHMLDNKLFSLIPCSESHFRDAKLYQYQYSILSIQLTLQRSVNTNMAPGRT